MLNTIASVKSLVVASVMEYQGRQRAKHLTPITHYWRYYTEANAGPWRCVTHLRSYSWYCTSQTCYVSNTNQLLQTTHRHSAFMVHNVTRHWRVGSEVKTACSSRGQWFQQIQHTLLASVDTHTYAHTHMHTHIHTCPCAHTQIKNLLCCVPIWFNEYLNWKRRTQIWEGIGSGDGSRSS